MAKNHNPDRPKMPELSPTAALRCPEAEPLFTGYLDGTLDAATLKLLDAHLVSCPECADELKLVRLGKDWLQILHADDLAAAAPAGLAEKILARTTGAVSPVQHIADSAKPVPVAAPKSAPWHQVNLAAVRSNMARTGLMDARLMMTAAMAFFSISITLNVAGIRLNDLRPSNLRHTVVRTYSDTNAHVERYYENMRVVYQLESRVRELRRAAEASDAAIRTTRQPQQHRKSTSGSPSTEQMTPQSMPQSNSRPAPSDGVARRDKAGKKSHTDTEPAPPAASPVTGDVLEASLQFPSVPYSLPQAERCNTGYEQDPRSEA